MVKKAFFLVMAIALFTGCDKKLAHLKMDRIPYTGDELRIDGYYYAYPATYDQYTDETSMNLAVLYNDGGCIHTRGVPGDRYLFSYIENEFLLNDAYIKILKTEPTHIGLFQIIDNDIEIQVWEYRSRVFSYYGEIVDDTTFIINKSKNHRTGKSFVENMTYRFKEFSPKPDISNDYTRAIILDD